MQRYLITTLFTLISYFVLAQIGVDENPPTDPDAGWTESPTLWILLAIVLLGALLMLRKRTKRTGR